MNTLSFSHNLVLKPQYQMCQTKLLYIENKLKDAIKPKNIPEFKPIQHVEPDYELVFGDTEFNLMLSNEYNTYDKPPFDTEEEWDIILMENIQTDEDFYGFDSDSEYDYTEDEIEYL